MRKALNKEGAQMGFTFWRSDYYYDCAHERFLHLPNHDF
jgi:hypothetical protein